MEGALTLLDAAMKADSTGKTADIVNMLAATNEILDDALWIEANSKTAHKTTILTGLPEATWTRLYRGPQPTKSTRVGITDTCGRLEVENMVERELLKLADNPGEYRIQEAFASMEAMSQKMASHLFYGSEAETPESFNGLAIRYNDLSAPSGSNVVDAGGTGTDNTSIWLVTWGIQSVHMIYPQNTMAGIEHIPLEDQRVSDGHGGTYLAAVDRFVWRPGLSVRDWRRVVRIANIDVSDLGTGSAADLINLMVDAVYKLPTTGGRATGTTKTDDPTIQGLMGKPVFYANNTVLAALDKQARSANNVYLTVREVDGAPMTSFRGIPIRRCDAILDTEARVT